MLITADSYFLWYENTIIALIYLTLQLSHVCENLLIQVDAFYEVQRALILITSN